MEKKLADICREGHQLEVQRHFVPQRAYAALSPKIDL